MSVHSIKLSLLVRDGGFVMTVHHHAMVALPGALSENKIN